MHTVVSCSSPRCPNNHDVTEPVLCDDCGRRVDWNLRRLPGLYRELENALDGSRRANRALEPIGGGGRPTGIPLNGQAVDARTTIRDVLAAWARLTVEELLVPAPPVEVTALVAFLRGHLDWLRGYPACGDLAEEIAELVALAVRAAHPAGSGARSVQVGDCVHDGCRGRLVAVMRFGERVLPSAVRCTANGEHSWSTRQWTTLSQQMRRTA